MVKGVNKTVIEVNDTGNKMFEKIVFYVSPQYGNLSNMKLKKAAGDLAKELNVPVTSSLRTRIKRKRRFTFAAILGAVLIICAITLIIFLI